MFDDFGDENDYDEVVGGPHFGEVVDGVGAATNEKLIASFGSTDEDEDVAEAEEVEAEEVAQTGNAMLGIPHGDRQGQGAEPFRHPGRGGCR